MKIDRRLTHTNKLELGMLENRGQEEYRSEMTLEAKMIFIIILECLDIHVLDRSR